MSQAQAQRLQRTIGILQIAIIVLIAITALVHLQRGIGMTMGGFGGGPPPRAGGIRPGGGPPGGGFNILRYLPLPLSYLFLLNGTGYLALGVALYFPALSRFRPIVRWVLIIFAVVTFFMYFLVNGFRLNPTGLLDKLVELMLIALLLIDSRRSSSRSAVAPIPT